MCEYVHAYIYVCVCASACVHMRVYEAFATIRVNSAHISMKTQSNRGHLEGAQRCVDARAAAPPFEDLPAICILRELLLRVSL